MAEAAVDLGAHGLQLDRQLGRGFAGEVWAATDIEAGGRAVAVKLITGVEGAVLHALAREVDSIVRLRHPNIATLYRARTSEPPRFLVYELLEQRPTTLPLDERAATGVGIKLCSSLAAAHRSGVVHCDIKPANILWRDGTEPLLSDFGSARIAATTRFREGFALTPDWCPPWMVEAGPSVADPVSDVWSLAASLLALHLAEDGGLPPVAQRDRTELSHILLSAMPGSYPTEPTDADWALRLGRQLQELQQRRGWTVTRFPSDDQEDASPASVPGRRRPGRGADRVERSTDSSRRRVVPIVVAGLVLAAAGVGGSYLAGWWPEPGESIEAGGEATASAETSSPDAAGSPSDTAAEPAADTGDTDPASDSGSGGAAEAEGAETGSTAEKDGSQDSSADEQPAVDGSGGIEWRSPMVFASDRRGNLDLFARDPDDGVRLLVGREADDYSPSLSPDGTTLVFESNEGGTRAVYLAPVDGSTAPRRLGAIGVETTAPTWSPTGDRIAWATNASGNWDIVVHDLNAGTDSLVTTATSDDRNPAWSPDGRSLVFRSDRTGNGDIYRLDLGGLRLTRLTDSALTEDNPAWGTGGLVAYEARVDGDIDVFTAPDSPDDGTGVDGPTRRTTGLGFDGSPAFDDDQLVIVQRTATSSAVVLDPGGESLVIDESSGRTADLEIRTG